MNPPQDNLKKEIEFGIMSSKYSMKANDLINGKMAMCLFFKQNIPIAIYKPKEEAFSPEIFLLSKPEIEDKKVKEAFKSIRKLQ